MSGRYPFERRRVLHAKEIMLDENTALRVPLSEDERFQLVASWYPDYRSQAELVPDVQHVEKEYETAKNIMRSLVNPAPLQLFGSPVYQEDGSHVQTVGQELHRVLVQAGEHTSKQIIDKCVRLLIELWRNGMSETVFNCTSAMQVLPDDTVILTDFYHVSQDVGYIESRLQTQAWRKNRMFKSQLADDLKAYVDLQFSRNLTVEKLRQEWKKHVR